ncbi:type II toxin-antitoxin system VapC family toxin [Aeromicrobium sp.]|uniref:type II toxin-antitoxin system VapC family toxin n=1 Tax=Aeromicrobium sp. TaxID=1871063 RepID=UPI003D6B7BEA
MTVHYADTSAWVKLIYSEAETDAMLDHLEDVRDSDGRFVSSELLATELHRTGRRLGVRAAGIRDALSELELVLPTHETFAAAGQLAGEVLRTLDALHVATALEAGASAFVTYDSRQAAAAEEAGLSVISPGA